MTINRRTFGTRMAGAALGLALALSSVALPGPAAAASRKRANWFLVQRIIPA